jgi:hypothetical protein
MGRNQQNLIQQLRQKLQITDQQLKATQEQMLLKEQQLKKSQESSQLTRHQLKEIQQKLQLIEEQLKVNQEKLKFTEEQLKATQMKLQLTEKELELGNSKRPSVINGSELSKNRYILAIMRLIGSQNEEHAFLIIEGTVNGCLNLRINGEELKCIDLLKSA